MQEEARNANKYIEKWYLLSQLIPPNNIGIPNMHTFGQRDFDLCFNREETMVFDGAVELEIEFK